MKEFLKKKKNIIILTIIVVVLIVSAGVTCTVRYYNIEQEKIRENNQKAIISQKSKAEILGEDKEETKKEYQEKYTEQYKEYLELPEEKKKETEIIPKKYEVNYTVINNIIKEQKENTDTQTKKKDNTDKKEDSEDAEILDTKVDYEFITPSKFNLSDKIKITVENQENYDLCWDFAATKSLETNLALTKNKNYNFSEMHVNYVTSNLLLGNREISDGGNFSIYEDYLIDSGVVLEETVGYQEYTKNEYEEFINLKPVVDVTKTVHFPTIYKYKENEYLTKEQINTVRNAVKNHIMNYGSVYAEVSMFDYDNETNTLYTNSDSEGWVDHAVTIVGWDDNYLKENFPEENRPKNNGAYIALNSWGEEFGDKGYFYISYEDLYVESGMSGIVSTSYEEAYNLDSIKNQEIENIILSRLSNTIKEKNGKDYITELALSRIYEIDLSNTSIKTLEDIEIFKNLYYLDLSNTEIENVNRLKNFKELTFLDLSDTKVKDVSVLKDCELYSINLSNNIGVKGYNKIKSLAELYLVNCGIRDVSNLKNIEYVVLDLSENTKIKNIEQLNNNVIYSLVLKGCKLQDISKVTGIKSLEYIDLSYNELSDITGIESLNNLSYIDLSGNKIKDFSNISLIKYDEYVEEENYPYITLIVEDANITNISLFNNLKNVSSLDLAKNNITDLSAFYNNSVYELDLSNNPKIYNIEYLKNLENIYALYLKYCNIQDLSEIQNLNNNIAILDLAYNNLTDIEGLNNLNIEALSLEGNNNIKGSLEIQTLNILNLANTEYDSEKFDFYRCSNLNELNISGCKDENIFNKILSEEGLENILYIVLEDTDITKEIFEKILNQEISIYGAKVNLKVSEQEDIKEEKEILSVKDCIVLRNIIQESIQYKDLHVFGGKISRNLYEIQKTSVNNAISIYIGWGSRVYDVTINIDCLKEETIDNLQKENEESTLKKEDELEEDSTEENQGVNNTVNNIESNSTEENIDLNNTVDNSEEKDQNYIMVED